MAAAAVKKGKESPLNRRSPRARLLLREEESPHRQLNQLDRPGGLVSESVRASLFFRLIERMLRTALTRGDVVFPPTPSVHAGLPLPPARPGAATRSSGTGRPRRGGSFSTGPGAPPPPRSRSRRRPGGARLSPSPRSRPVVGSRSVGVHPARSVVATLTRSPSRRATPPSPGMREIVHIRERLTCPRAPRPAPSARRGRPPHD